MDFSLLTSLDGGTLAFIAFAMAAGGFIKGICGLGFPIVAMGIMTQSLPVPLCLALLVGPLVVTNLWQAATNGIPLHAVRRYWMVIVCLIGFTFVGARLVVGMDPRTLFLIVGGVVIVFCATNLWSANLRLPERFEKPLAPVAGTVAGLMAGLSGIWGPPITMYFLAIQLRKDDFVQAVGLTWASAAVPLLIAYELNGISTAETRPLALLSIVPALAALWIGERIRDRLPQETFRKVLLIIFAVIGANLVRRGLF